MSTDAMYPSDEEEFLAPPQVFPNATPPRRKRTTQELTSIQSDLPTTRRSDLSKSDNFIWLSNVKIVEAEEMISKFITGFKVDGISKYQVLIEELSESEESTLVIDCGDLYSFDQNLYNKLVHYPQEIIPLMDLFIQNYFLKQFGKRSNIIVRTSGLREVKHMRMLGPEDIDHLICIRGMVTRVSEVIPDIKQGFFKCSICGHEVIVTIDRGRIDEPGKCHDCGANLSMTLIHNRCQFSDKQLIKLQETPDSIPESETPQTVNLCVFDSLVDSVKPGDRVDVCGIYRAVSQRTSPKQRQITNIFKNYVDVIHFQRTGLRVTDGDVGSGNIEPSGPLKFSKEEELEIQDFSNSENVIEKLRDSLAPSIFKMNDVKYGILCQLFGGVSKVTPNSKIRGELHVLLMGDPGVSKSQLLLYINKIAPRGIYTSGKGSSAVGLTAYVMKEEDTGEYVLESGALVLSDTGICCIDEFDKMSDSARSILHEVMEQQTVSIAKAGIICSLNARTSVLAAANPKESKYNENLSLVENIQLPPTLLSRFDMIFLLKDKPDRNEDRKLAKHIIGMLNMSDVRQPAVEIKFLTKYISYAKANCNPIITNQAGEKMVEAYLGLRKLGGDRKQITATTRQLESLIRMSESLARMTLSAYVEEEHVIEAQRLLMASTFQAVIDPHSGQIDMDLLNTGITKEQRDKAQKDAQEDDDLGRDID
jgi:DNA replication licensing factor MCM4